MARRTQIEELLRSDPLFQGVLADHPELRDPLREQFREAIRTGDREVSVRAGRQILGGVLPAYMAKAPDDALVQFGEAQLATLKALQPNGHRCFQFANPLVDGAVAPTEEEGRARIEEALRTLIRAARENPRESARGDGESLLGAVSGALYEDYGDEVGMLATPADPDLDRARYCEILISLYEGVLGLPAAESASVFRFIMGQGASKPETGP